ncbi:MFS transporter [Megasphaera sp.]|jgi:predicted MFS family arabinose efflux permease|uniref:MFS transporter n=1 Tax=Megasphaera sp. TaxID=2023260 RepID=UPI00266EDDD9|nr:MFS transporter [uncultured Megasphaera sp.]
MNKRDILWQIYSAKAFYFLGGFGFTSWASLIPFLRQQLQIQDDHLGFLLLAVGLGALIMMMLAGSIAGRLGCRRSLTIAGLAIAVVLNVLCYVPAYAAALVMAVLLGSSLGLLDVVVNINGIFIERKVHKRLMSGLQAMWSLGNFAGAAFFASLLHLGFYWKIVMIAGAVFIGLCVCFFAPHLHEERQASGKGASLVLPKGKIVLIGLVCTIAFLVEGSINDWSGVFMTTEKGIDISQSGLGLTLFTASAFLARLPGDSLTMHFGPRRLLALSLPVAFAGFLGILLISGGPLLFASYILIGVGCANTVPIFYSSLGTQKDMPVADAVAAVSTIGYAGILLAPAVLGFIGRAFSLTASFTLVTALLVIMSIMAMRLLRGK